MVTRIGINGAGRIGRMVTKTITDRYPGELMVVALNDPFSEPRVTANMLKYDSTYGRWSHDVEDGNDHIKVDGRYIPHFSEREPASIPWEAANVDIVVESTGVFTDASRARAHMRGPVKKVIISAPAKNEDITLVLGVNAEKYDPARHDVVSNASCTTNGLAPVVKVIVDNLGIVKGQMTTIHSYTNSQQILDKAAGNDLREMRSGPLNIVPTSTGAAKALRLVIPEVDGKLDGLSYRVPTPTVSIVEIVALTERDTTKEELNELFRQAAAGTMGGILDITMDPVVSMDMKGNERSSVVDGMSTNVVGGNLVKVAAWYDNEWAYACRISDLCMFLADRGLS